MTNFKLEKLFKNKFKKKKIIKAVENEDYLFNDLKHLYRK